MFGCSGVQGSEVLGFKGLRFWVFDEMVLDESVFDPHPLVP